MRPLPLLKHRGSFSESLIRKLFAHLSRSTESMHAMRKLIDRKLEILSDVP
jgi:hypothetical protein